MNGSGTSRFFFLQIMTFFILFFQFLWYHSKGKEKKKGRAIVILVFQFVGICYLIKDLVGDLWPALTETTNHGFFLTKEEIIENRMEYVNRLTAAETPLETLIPIILTEQLVMGSAWLFLATLFKNWAIVGLMGFTCFFQIMWELNLTRIARGKRNILPYGYDRLATPIFCLRVVMALGMIQCFFGQFK